MNVSDIHKETQLCLNYILGIRTEEVQRINNVTSKKDYNYNLGLLLMIRLSLSLLLSLWLAAIVPVNSLSDSESE
jgi:hypothetical protein